MNNTLSTSNIIPTVSPIPIEKIIEENVEKKINQLLESSLYSTSNKYDKNIYSDYNYASYTLTDLYKGTIQTVIDIINDITILLSDRYYISMQVFRSRLLNIFFKNERKFFVGIILVILSFIIYFIDGSSI
jgi:hypothetical protein